MSVIALGCRPLELMRVVARVVLEMYYLSHKQDGASCILTDSEEEGLVYPARNVRGYIHAFIARCGGYGFGSVFLYLYDGSL